ncbi:MAG TPA: hypothetical protein VFR49_01335 [Solirubrobacteraceae bacterium]|nr:hypothetical protein [Solirubrobacteraceae bacterium]
MKVRRSKWFFPAYAVGLGLVIGGAEALGGHLVRGVESLALMTGFGLLVLVGGRSETVRGLRGDGRDERFAMIDLRATAIAGSTLIVAVLVAWLVDLARGRDGSPYTWLASVAGAAYVAAVAFLRWRR